MNFINYPLELISSDRYFILVEKTGTKLTKITFDWFAHITVGFEYKKAIKVFPGVTNPLFVCKSACSWQKKLYFPLLRGKYKKAPFKGPP